MPSATKASAPITQNKLALKRLGPSDYGLKLGTVSGQTVDLRVFGTYVPGGTPNSTVQNAWVWTAQIDGLAVDSPETLTRKRDAVDLLVKELAKRGIEEGKPVVPVSTPVTSSAIADKVKEQADATHPMFQRRRSTDDPTKIDPILKAMVKIKGTTLTGVVIAMTQGTPERLRLEFPEGFHAWANRDVVEEVVL